MSKVKLYNTKAFTEKFIPAKELKTLLKSDFEKFFVVLVEEMYRLIDNPVPASRTTNHTCIFLTDGEAYMKIGSEFHIIYKNEMLFIPAGQVFSFEEYNNSKFNKGYLCSFNNDILVGMLSNTEPFKLFEFLNVWGNPLVKLDVQTSSYILHIFQRLFSEFNQAGLKNMEIIQSYLITFLYEVNRVYKPLSNSNKTSAVNITNKFKELIFTNIKVKHLVTDYATLINISPNHLNKTVKAITSKSPTKWIDDAILLEAKILLTQSNMTVSEIAFEIGFEDPSYFSRFFKRYEKISPSEFRKRIEISL